MVTTWRDLLAQYHTTWCTLERELNDKHGLGASEFEVLDHMVESGEAKFRVQWLTDVAHLTQSALSRLIARLEKEDLVQRAICDSDRRGVFVIITDSGRRRHAEALPTHRAVLADVLTTWPAMRKPAKAVSEKIINGRPEKPGCSSS
ncbi:MarR family transcriptional regulator [Sinosporangium siamense]|uniref:MarR family transcriptional regulator n=1 Tax=Sinosporangium siamense TaxID=1367973 RepID=A0A919RBI7_9ACTN|nr:MarR family transcriptional regulator [Sinosporangium siamense]